MDDDVLRSSLNTLKEGEDICEYDFLIALFLYLRAKGSPVLLTELNVMSGYALRFLYAYDKPNIYNESIEYIKENLNKSLEIRIELLSLPEEKETIIEALKENMIIFYPENILLRKSLNGKMEAFKSFFEEDPDLDKLLYSNSLGVKITSTGITDRKKLYSLELFKAIVRLLVSNFNEKEIYIDGKSVYSGSSAMDHLIFDLKDPEKDFLHENSAWLNKSLYSQFTSIYGLHAYLLGIYHFLNFKTQDEAVSIIRAIEDSFIFFKEFGRQIGRESFYLPSKTFPMEIRRRASNVLEKSFKSLSKAVYLMDYLFLKERKNV